MKSSGKLEEGFVTFVGESSKDVMLQVSSRPSSIQAMIVELPTTYNTGSSPNTEKDIPSRYTGNVQISAYWLSNAEFRLTTSAPFYGNVRWVVSS